jgi:hypothetical protein
MSSRARRRYLTAWIACLAILVGALMPAASRVLASAAGASQVAADVCSVNGAGPPQAKFAAGHDMTPAGDGVLHLDHCAFCLTHAGSFGLLPAAAIALPVLDPAPDGPVPVLPVPRQLAAWTGAQPRAPPFPS